MNREIYPADEKERLSAYLKEFTNEMEKNLHEKVDEGRAGWDNPEWPLQDIKRLLIEHVEKGDFADAANFALFAWYQNR